MGKKNDTSKPAPAITAETSAPKKKTSKPAPAVAAPAAASAPAPSPAPAAVATNGSATAKAKKKPAPKAAAPKKAAANADAPKTVTFTTEDIALRAYFIAEDRHRHGHHGDSHSDWVEAERQLQAEHGRKKPAARKKA